MNALRSRAGWLSMLLLALLAGCAATPPTGVHQPMSARAAAQPQPAEASGGIYQPVNAQANYRYLPLFEDRRARNVGDSLIVVINEKTNASKKSSSSVNRGGSTSFSVPVIAGLPGRSFENAALSAESDNKFNGGGSSASNNDFSGTIAVTVIEVLPNNNLLVSGEKQLGINQGKEFIRFSGVVDPRNITGSNTVSSMQVADARIEYRGNGYLDEAQMMGWLSRFFLSFLPF